MLLIRSLTGPQSPPIHTTGSCVLLGSQPLDIALSRESWQDRAGLAYEVIVDGWVSAAVQRNRVARPVT